MLAQKTVRSQPSIVRVPTKGTGVGKMGAVVCSQMAKPGFVANATGLDSHGARRISTGWPGYIGYNGRQGRAARPGTDAALSEISAGVAAIVR